MPQLHATANRSIIAQPDSTPTSRQDTIIRYSIVAPEEGAQTAQQRLPLNIGLVVDRSGSMQGDKLKDAVAACHRIVQRLSEEDRCTVVAFDSHAQLLADGEKVSSARRALITQALHAINVGGSTNLHEGWKLAADQVFVRQQQAPAIGHIMLLTDGMANQGITDIEMLEAMARDYQSRGISISTYGLGAGYAEQELRRIAEAGQGTHQFIESSIDIERYFSNELSELFTVTYRDVQLHIRIPAHMTVEVIGQLPHNVTPDGITITIGAMVSREQRNIFIRLTPLAPGETSLLTVAATLQGRRNDETLAQVNCTTDITVAHPTAAAHTPIDGAVEYEAVLVDIAHVRSEAQRLNRTGRMSEASAYVLQMQARSDVFLRYPIYTQLADEMRGRIDDWHSKRSESLNFMSKRGSLKDLLYLKEQLAALLQRGIDNTEVSMLRHQIDILENIINHRNRER